MTVLRSGMAICGAFALTLAAYGQQSEEATQGQSPFQERQIVPGFDREKVVGGDRHGRRAAFEHAA
jgi:hypothetical protein